MTLILLQHRRMNRLLITTVLLVLSGNSVWAQKLPCEEKLQVLEQQGIHRGAFLQALKNSRSDQKPSRYVLMAHLGRERQGELHVLDVQTGQVIHMGLRHGIPENAGDAANYKNNEITYFGGVTLENTNSGYSLAASSPSLKSRLKGQKLGAEASLMKCGQGNLVGQATASGLCLDAADLAKLQNLLKQDSGSPARMFIYPTRNLDNYLNQSKLANDEPRVCEVLSKMPEPSGKSRDASSSSGVN